jgi:peptide/nickel transport system ATP-binding protein
MDNLLRIQDLTQVFGTRNPNYAVDRVSFSMPDEPSILSLVGESGSGKSTIARIALGLMKPTSGKVYFKGTDIFTGDRKWQKQFRRDVQPVFQDPYSAFNPAYRLKRVFNIAVRNFDLVQDQRKAQARIEESLDSVGLDPDDVLDKYPHQLSGGQRQRVMLARLHLIRPRLIIADEPVSMIDASMRASFLKLLVSFRDNLGISTLFITHDLTTSMYLGGRIIVLYKGRIMEHGDTPDVTRSPQHPYAKLLINSIPVADPSQRWDSMLPASVDSANRASMNRDRCLFAERCGQVMETCWQQEPRVLPQENAVQRDVACHLYEKTLENN